MLGTMLPHAASRSSTSDRVNWASHSALGALMVTSASSSIGMSLLSIRGPSQQTIDGAGRRRARRPRLPGGARARVQPRRRQEAAQAPGPAGAPAGVAGDAGGGAGAIGLGGLGDVEGDERGGHGGPFPDEWRAMGTG